MSTVGRDIIVMGASAGGVYALQRLMAALPADLPGSIFIVQHLWGGSPSYLASILQRAGPLKVVEAANGMRIEPRTVYVAPPDVHLFVEPEHVALLRGPRENRTRPAINPLFRSAAAAYRNRVIGVILSGTLDDGTAGLWAVKQAGGIAIAQSDAEYMSMPQAAVENVDVDHFVPLEEIPGILDRLVREPVVIAPAARLPDVVKVSDGGAKMKTDSTINLDKVGTRSVFSCPECNGALWELNEGGVQFRCHVGHAYSAGVLRKAQTVNIEQALWTALRALKESAALDQRLAKRSDEHGLDKAAVLHRKNADDKLVQVERLQEFLAVLRPDDSAATEVG
jgi:two-component system chemotaxis response regulator CheB